MAHPALLPLAHRHEAETLWLSTHQVPPRLARAAAARAAALFGEAERAALPPQAQALLPGWLAPMASDISPGPTRLAELFDLSAEEAGRLHGLWSWLGTADALMETGGDIRLARDPKTALNGYGCSHRPRPWAITFASSTASSSSERGYIAADKARLQVSAALLRGMAPQRALASCIGAVRRGLGRAYGLRPGEEIVLAASGTDTELLALALTHLAGTGQPILNILIAPEETGRGVPMAARGQHFAVDTALGHDVTFEAPIEGFRPDTALANIALRSASGAVRPQSEVEAEIEAVLDAALAQGRRVILHGLDLSKTGLLAPSPAFLADLRARYGRGSILSSMPARRGSPRLRCAPIWRWRRWCWSPARNSSPARLSPGRRCCRLRWRHGWARRGCQPGWPPISTRVNSRPAPLPRRACRRAAITGWRCAGTRHWRRCGRCCVLLRSVALTL
ncbi:hypothetical protein GT370_07910 [Acidocella sp. MX-AZ03]|uniref:hypothetical protein n=1 Tax=Acidocella sp. MX-AZ03 TaxID=2697363 RepID=UPI0022DD162A|nr:hypothetical protein [Acidocella sp. MX-AZ03]WBO60677.1 hypothetical protein GT370_07910 [Acidocella sp. MX-AZ03]